MLTLGIQMASCDRNPSATAVKYKVKCAQAIDVSFARFSHNINYNLTLQHHDGMQQDRISTVTTLDLTAKRTAASQEFINSIIHPRLPIVEVRKVAPTKVHHVGQVCTANTTTTTFKMQRSPRSTPPTWKPDRRSRHQAACVSSCWFPTSSR